MYSFPQTLGLFMRELLAVTFILLVEQRVGSYDYFNSAFILFLVFITFRTPYVNSYAFIFEIGSIKKWANKQHAGLQKHEGFAQNLFLFVAVLGAHIGAAIAAAALRVLIDVAYGTETVSYGQIIDPVLNINVESLKGIDPFWGTEKRIERLAAAGLFNGSRSGTIPLHDISFLGLDSVAIALWYLVEEIGYVSLLCICYVHIWLGAGLAKDEMKPLEPFKSEYWKRLFRMSIMLAMVNTALTRCFPTAHGSLHHTIYRCQYQAWNPEMYLVDTNNQEPMIRVLGGLIGVVVALVYNQVLLATRDNKDDDGYYYRMVWGREPVSDSSIDQPSSAKAIDGGTQMFPDRRYSRIPGGGRFAKVAPVFGKDDDDRSDFFMPPEYDVHTICVSRCKKHPNGVGCSAECKMNMMESEIGLSNGFKLRIPYTLDHPK
jgi:hypothetical protein